jgi:hypothetical protein
MRFSKSILCGVSAITFSVGAAFAGESSTHRWHGWGPGYYESNGGMTMFNPACAEGSMPSQCSYMNSSIYSSGHAFAGSQNPDMNSSAGS